MKLNVALGQLCSTPDIEENLKVCARMTREAAAAGVDWVLFPENAPFLSRDRDKLAHLEDDDGEIVEHFRALARETGCWITLGSYAERSPSADHSYNTQLLIEPGGQVRAKYRKLHLFDVELEGGISYRESDSIMAGSWRSVAPLERGGQEVKVGLSTCYDLRFPGLYQELVRAGAKILTVPSAFTLQTGPHHWHPLLQARAIENQCYVLAPNQWGNHIPGRDSFGQSAIYDPWGRRVACAPDRVGWIQATLDIGYVDEVRRRIPCLRELLDDV